MNQGTINFILQQMTGCLNNSQMMRLQNTLNESLQLAEDKSVERSSSELLEAFLAVKRLEGRSDKTLALYRYNIGMILGVSDKNACVMTTDDIQKCLAQYQEEHGVNKATLDNVRRNLSSFFRWLEDENYIFKSPLRRIHKIKTTVSIRDTYADEELEKLRDDCKELRNLAIIDMLNSTGMRVGELVKSAHRKYIG